LKDVTKSLFFTVLKLQKIEVLKLQKIEFMKRFYKQLFYSFKTAKKLLMGTAISYFMIFCHCHCHCLKKAHFFSFKTKKKNWLEVKKKCYFSHVFKTPFYAVLILPKNAVSKRQLCLRFETPDYNHKRTLLYA